MNPSRLARRNARLCPMLAMHGPFAAADGPYRWYPRDLVEVRGIRTLRCFGPLVRGQLSLNRQIVDASERVSAANRERDRTIGLANSFARAAKRHWIDWRNRGFAELFRLRAENAALAAIVRAVHAADAAEWRAHETRNVCRLCDVSDDDDAVDLGYDAPVRGHVPHLESCLWRLAAAWVAANPVTP